MSENPTEIHPKEKEKEDRTIFDYLAEKEAMLNVPEGGTSFFSMVQYNPERMDNRYFKLKTDRTRQLREKNENKIRLLPHERIELKRILDTSVDYPYEYFRDFDNLPDSVKESIMTHEKDFDPE